MSYLRIQVLLLLSLSTTAPAHAAANGDLDPRVLLMQTADSKGRCRQGNGDQGPDGCCGTSFQAMTGSIASGGAKNLCFGAQSISAISSGAVSQGTAQQVSPPVYAATTGGGTGSSRASAPATTSFFGDGPSEAGTPTFLGGGGGTPNVGAPGPDAGAGLPFLLVAGAYALVRRHRARRPA